MFAPRSVSRALAVVAALVLLGVAGPALASQPSHAGAVPPAVAVTPAVRPAATDYVYPTDSGGYTSSNFYVSLSSGAIYFTAYDPSDSSARVTITDQNATRDNVNVPAASWNASFAAGPYNYSYLWNEFYLLPLGLSQGGTWNITISGANAGVFSTSFTVHVYRVQLSSDEGAYLPGHTATVTWSIYATVNGAPFARLASLTAVGYYFARNGSQVALFGGAAKALPVGAIGNLTVSIPTNAPTYSAVQITVYANQTGAGGTSSEQGFLSLAVGSLRPVTLGLGTCPSGCATSTFAANGLVFVTASAWVSNGYGGLWPAVGLTLHFTLSANGVNVTTVPGAPPLTQITNASGGVAFVFLTDPTVFSTTHPNRVSVNVSDPIYVNTSVRGFAAFTVLPPSQSPALLALVLSQVQYYSGDTLSASWTLGGASPAAVQGWQADSWYVYDLLSGGLRATGLINTTASSGSFQWAIPAPYQGSVDVDVMAHNATASIYALVSTTVAAPALLLSPSEVYYQPGDTVTVSVGTQGSIFNGATLFATAVAPTGTIYWSGTVTGGSFSLTLPSAAPPSDLHVSVAAQSAAAGLISTASLYLYAASGYTLVAGVDTPSNYIDGSYQPGQTITLHYTLTALGSYALAQAYHVTVYPAVLGNNLNTQAFDTHAASGTVSYTLPSSLPSGTVLFEIVVQLLGCTQYPCSASTLFSVPVEAHPPVLGYQIGAGSGVTVGWLILLALIVVVALFVWRGVRGRRRPMMMTPLAPVSPAGGTEGSSSPKEPGAPVSSTTGGSPASWQEEGGSAGRSGAAAPPGSPPLPRPPSNP
jgi:hypothetical protein